jgi:hypothetical protein
LASGLKFAFGRADPQDIRGSAPTADVVSAPARSPEDRTMSLRIPGLSPPQPAALRRQDDARARAERTDTARAEPRSQVSEPAADQWVPRAEGAGPEPPLSPMVAESATDRRQFEPAAVAPGPDAAILTAESVKRAVQARPPQATGIHGNLVASTVLNLLA